MKELPLHSRVPIELSSFREMVKTMRSLQRFWFRHHQDKDLRASKGYERRVDNWLATSKQENDLISLVRKLRESQITWFTHRKPSDLHACKEYEKRVDAWYKKDSEGPGLFD